MSAQSDPFREGGLPGRGSSGKRVFPEGGLPGRGSSRKGVFPEGGLPGSLRLLLPLGALLAFVGYVGPWVDHRVAGLAILGLDLGEYVKFLPQVRAGATGLWREGFYLPLVAISLTLSLCAWRPDLRWPVDGFTRSPAHPLTRSLGWLLVALQVAGAIAAALNLLPPAWTPGRMLTPEFQQQAAALLLCLAAVAFGPFLALLPRQVTGALVLLLCLPAAIVPVWQFLVVLPEIAALYNHPLTAGWGLYVMVAGLLLLTALGGLMVVAGWIVSGNDERT